MDWLSLARESEVSRGWGYEIGDNVSADGLIFQCKTWAGFSHCSQDGYEPNMNSAMSDTWKDACAVLGYYSRTNSPASSPNYVALQYLGGCPGVYAWEWGIHFTYEGGDQVVVNGLIFQCNPWPYLRRVNMFHIIYLPFSCAAGGTYLIHMSLFHTDTSPLPSL